MEVKMSSGYQSESRTTFKVFRHIHIYGKLHFGLNTKSSKKSASIILQLWWMDCTLCPCSLTAGMTNQAFSWWTKTPPSIGSSSYQLQLLWSPPLRQKRTFGCKHLIVSSQDKIRARLLHFLTTCYGLPTAGSCFQNVIKLMPDNLLSHTVLAAAFSLEQCHSFLCSNNRNKFENILQIWLNLETGNGAHVFVSLYKLALIVPYRYKWNQLHNMCE